MSQTIRDDHRIPIIKEVGAFVPASKQIWDKPDVGNITFKELRETAKSVGYILVRKDRIVDVHGDVLYDPEGGGALRSPEGYMKQAHMGARHRAGQAAVEFVTTRIITPDYSPYHPLGIIRGTLAIIKEDNDES